MDVELRIVGDDSLEELGYLEDWILEDPSMHGSALSRRAPSLEPGEMGALSEVLVVALGSGGSGAALAGALCAWLRTRVQDITLKIRTDRGEVALDARNVKDLNAMIEMIVGAVKNSDEFEAS